MKEYSMVVAPWRHQITEDYAPTVPTGIRMRFITFGDASRTYTIPLRNVRKIMLHEAEFVEPPGVARLVVHHKHGVESFVYAELEDAEFEYRNIVDQLEAK